MHRMIIRNVSYGRALKRRSCCEARIRNRYFENRDLTHAQTFCTRVPTMHWAMFFCIALCSTAHFGWIVLGEREFDDGGVCYRSLYNSLLR